MLPGGGNPAAVRPAYPQPPSAALALSHRTSCLLSTRCTAATSCCGSACGRRASGAGWLVGRCCWGWQPWHGGCSPAGADAATAWSWLHGTPYLSQPMPPPRCAALGCWWRAGSWAPRCALCCGTPPPWATSCCCRRCPLRYRWALGCWNAGLWVSASLGCASMGLCCFSGLSQWHVWFCPCMGLHPTPPAPPLPPLPPLFQLFIFYTIQQYGALHFALIMTLRQFLSIVLSCLVFSHALSGAQWCADRARAAAGAQRPCRRGAQCSCCRGAARRLPARLPAHLLACLGASASRGRCRTRRPPLALPPGWAPRS